MTGHLRSFFNTTQLDRELVRVAAVVRVVFHGTDVAIKCA
jgi:hypothetical protein